MRAREEAIKSSIGGLLVSGMQGEIRDGDQLGVWTFNNELHTGDFELVIWDESTRDTIIGGVLQFLDKVRFRKSTDFSKVMPHLMDVVADSQRITVILVSDGDEAIQGTPFDQAIAAYLQANVDVIKDKRAPILTVMRGYKGELIGHSMSYPPWPIVFPEFPPEPEPAPRPPLVNTAKVAAQPDLSRTLVTTNKGPIVFAEPLIVSGPSRRDSTPSPGSLSGTNGSAADMNPTSAALIQETNALATEVGASPQVERADEARELPDTGADGRSRSRVYLVVLIGGVVVLMAIVAGIALTRRPRMKQRASLITRSMNKKGGPK